MNKVIQRSFSGWLGHVLYRVRLLHIRSLFVIFTLLASSAAFANDKDQAINIHQLQSQGGVTIEAWVGEQRNKTVQQENADQHANNEQYIDLSKPQRFSVNEQVILTIEVATPRWFTGGTRIGSVEIPNVIAKQRNSLATNYTERIKGVTWSKQRWEVTLYPQTTGEFVIPKIPVTVQVSAEGGNKVSGALYTMPIAFDTVLPSGLLTEDMPWFSASDVDANQEWLRSSESLKVGDAITRTITINAKDSLSILLPNLLVNESTDQYQAYPQPHRLHDTQERGDYRSQRVEESVYVIQQGGEFTLPKQTFQWWNSQSQRLETVTLTGKTFNAKHTLSSFLKAYAPVIFIVCIGVVGAIIGLIAIAKYYKRHPLPNWLQLYRLVKAGHWGKIRGFIYQKRRAYSNQLELSSCDSSENWQHAQHQFQQGSQDTFILNIVWKKVKRSDNHQNRQPWWRRYIPKALPSLDRDNLR